MSQCGSGKGQHYRGGAEEGKRGGQPACCGVLKGVSTGRQADSDKALAKALALALALASRCLARNSRN